MNSLEEIKDYVSKIDCGDSTYRIITSYRNTEIIAKLDDWPEIDSLHQSNNWIIRQIGGNLQRRFCSIENKMIIDSDDEIRLINGIRNCIATEIISMSSTCSPADQPNRTKAHKEMISLCYEKQDDDQFINDTLPIVNYYLQSKLTDPNNMKIHRNNVFALFEIIRKKYGN